ncbi:DNA polymerase epsilon subunit 4 [Fasciola gigantica]|uniref:DNA polymerase epsilon subunit 4 n=1 Tax=Fasciola gigantica TaxID=46835 RepID=A0A504YRW6_FASGI|nr:DNA polymerase epsilon subunit 4 [Fasciola gigantica]
MFEIFRLFQATNEMTGRHDDIGSISPVSLHDELDTPDLEDAPIDAVPNESESTTPSNFEQTELSKPSEQGFRFPVSRIKTIMKTVPSVHLVNSEAIVVVEKALDLFMRNFFQDVHKFTVLDHKKTISRNHVDSAIRHIPLYEFLDGMLD